MDGAQRVGFFNIGSGLVFEKILGFGLGRSVEMYYRLFLGIFFTLGYFWVFLGISWYSWVFPGIPVYFRVVWGILYNVHVSFLFLEVVSLILRFVFCLTFIEV